VRLITFEGSGLSKEDFAASVATLKSIAESLDAACILLRERTTDALLTAQYLIRRRAPERDFTEIRSRNLRRISKTVVGNWKLILIFIKLGLLLLET